MAILILILAVLQFALVGAILWQVLDLVKRMNSVSGTFSRGYSRMKADVDAISEGGRHLGVAVEGFKEGIRAFAEDVRMIRRRKPPAS